MFGQRRGRNTAAQECDVQHQVAGLRKRARRLLAEPVHGKERVGGGTGGEGCCQRGHSCAKPRAQSAARKAWLIQAERVRFCPFPMTVTIPLTNAHSSMQSYLKR